MLLSFAALSGSSSDTPAKQLTDLQNDKDTISIDAIARVIVIQGDKDYRYHLIKMTLRVIVGKHIQPSLLLQTVLAKDFTTSTKFERFCGWREEIT